MALAEDLINIKSAGVSRKEFDKSAIQTSYLFGISNMRLIPGFSKKGAFNKPILITSASQFTSMFGSIDRELEKKGSFFHRTVLQSLQSGAVTVINLHAYKDLEKTPVTYIGYGEDPKLEAKFNNIFDTTLFYEPSKDNFHRFVTENTNVGGVYLANTSTEPVTVLLVKNKKDEPSMYQYNVTMESWYNASYPENIQEFLDSQDDEEFATNHTMDEFVYTIYAFKGDWSKGISKKFKEFLNKTKDCGYDETTKTVRLVSDVKTLDKIGDISGVNLIGKWTGMTIAETQNKLGQNITLEKMVNDDVMTTNLVCCIPNVIYETEKDIIIDNPVVDDDIYILSENQIVFKQNGSTEDDVTLECDFSDLIGGMVEKNMKNWRKDTELISSGVTTKTLNYVDTPNMNFSGNNPTYTISNTIYDPIKTGAIASPDGYDFRLPTMEELYECFDLLVRDSRLSLGADVVFPNGRLIIDGVEFMKNGYYKDGSKVDIPNTASNPISFYIPSGDIVPNTNGVKYYALKLTVNRNNVGTTVPPVYKYETTMTTVELSRSSACQTIGLCYTDDTIDGTIKISRELATSIVLSKSTNLNENGYFCYGCTYDSTADTYNTIPYNTSMSEYLELFDNDLTRLEETIEVNEDIVATTMTRKDDDTLKLTYRNESIIERNYIYYDLDDNKYKVSEKTISCNSISDIRNRINDYIGDGIVPIAIMSDDGDNVESMIDNALVAKLKSCPITIEYNGRISYKSELSSILNLLDSVNSVSNALVIDEIYTDHIKFKSNKQSTAPSDPIVVPGKKETSVYPVIVKELPLGVVPNGSDENQNAILNTLRKDAYEYEVSINGEKTTGVYGQTNLFRALSDRDYIQWRYLVDSFGLGLEPSCKSVYSELCHNRQSAFAIVNFPSAETLSSNADLVDKRTLGINYKNLATAISANEVIGLPNVESGATFVGYYYPYVNIYDMGDTKAVPPSGLVSNLFVNKYANNNIHAIVAGINRGVLYGVAGPEVGLIREDRNYIEPMGINSIIYTSNEGTYVYGNKTAKQTPISSLSSINCRETCIYILDTVEAMLKNYVFEINNSQTRLQIWTMVDTFLKNLKSKGGIYDYNVVMDESNNTPEVIDNQFGILDMSIECSKGMEKIHTRLNILKTGAIASGEL